MTETQNTVKQEERIVVTINGKDYYADSFPEQEKIALIQIEQINADIERKKIDIRNLEYARQFLTDYLSQNVEKFEEVPQPENNGGDAA